MAYNKYYLQKRQVSYDNGLTWEDVTPSETRQGTYIDSYETLSDCEGVIDYSKQYLTIESLDNYNYIYWYAQNASNTKTISASTDNGETWTAYTSSTGGTTIAILNTGDKLLLKGENEAYSNSYSNHFDSTGGFEVYGNIMSLVSGDSFENVTSVAPYAFQALFANCVYLIFAENLILPATTLGHTCYNSMFRNCLNLDTAPKLPALNLTQTCYYRMFYGCTNLNSITCLATVIAAYNSTTEWLSGVASSGTFVKAANATWTTGDSGIPEGWTVIDNS